MQRVGGHYDASKYVVGAEIPACKPFGNHNVSLSLKAGGTVAAQQLKVEHREERRVGVNGVHVQNIVALSNLDAAFHHAACVFYLRIVHAQVSQRRMVTAHHPAAVIHKLKSYIIYSVGLAVLAVDAELLPCVQSDDDDKHQTDSQSEHVNCRVSLVS